MSLGLVFEAQARQRLLLLLLNSGMTKLSNTSLGLVFEAQARQRLLLLLLNSGMTCQIIFRVLTLLADLGEPFICF